jgi:hypothetical protein
VLDGLGLHATVATEGHLPSIGSWSAWGGTEPWGRDFIFNPFGHGWHLDRRRFDALLRATAHAAGAQPATATVVASDALPSGGFRLHLAGGHEMTAQIVLDATGRNASFARQRGVKRRAIDRMIGLIGYVARRTDAETEPAATLVEAVPEGWWYSAPLPQDRLVTVFMTDADLAREAGISAQAWLDRLASAEHSAARALRYGLGLAGPPFIVPAASGRPKAFWSHSKVASRARLRQRAHSTATATRSWRRRRGARPPGCAIWNNATAITAWSDAGARRHSGGGAMRRVSVNRGVLHEEQDRSLCCSRVARSGPCLRA